MSTETIQQNVIQEVEQFVNDEIRPYVNQFEEQSGIPLELIRKMAAKGYLAAPLPYQYGGLGLDPVSYGQFTEVIGKACSATRSLITVHTSLVSETLLRFGTEAQKDKWLPKLASGEVIGAFGLSEPDVGSDAKSIKTVWREEVDHYVLDGVKKWITFGDIADVFIVIASNQGKSTAFIVERSFPGVTTKRIEGLMAGRATYLAEIHLESVEVPKENVLGKVNFGFEYIVSTALDNGRYSIAWAGVGIAQEAVEAMVTYARNRIQFDQKLSDFQLIRGMIGDSVTKVHAARALCLRAGELRKAKDSDATMETTMAKYFTSKVAVDVTNDALQVHGANGFTNQYPVERLYREAKVLEIIEGSSQMQQEIISHYGLRQYYKRSKKR
ncbi:acyl-CoA dehydrogenase family protein [Paenibacillus sp. SC116]|uniref:acyl-CoA dehydrogenase family protein n=1 Tax=Paenibacillus sp. SC116 TaxID=2968986 RepID=UPI00215A3B2D|nr:acyl-CoA dehydrogenase family protein [Paenibacillus sp. SC116]MCR8844310.1 acyl-CoA dehydrogenase family protein [Paenibacillus sp. SC116]